MSEPRRRPGLPRLIAAAVFVLLIIGGLYLQSRPPAAPSGPATPDPEPVGVSAVQPPAAIAPLGRSDLLEIVAVASSAFAKGDSPAELQHDLVGRRFELHLPFGCQGPVSPNSQLAERWEYDRDTTVIKARVAPQSWTDAAWLRAIVGEAQLEAAEGFWIRRPWLRDEACPAFRSPLDVPALLEEPRQTLALVELSGPEDSRVFRRDGRPYEATQKLAPDELDPAQGLRLALEGQLSSFPGGRPVGCWSETPDVRPICAVAVRFEQVRIETPDGNILGAWHR